MLLSEFFIRQENDFSCGPAALATIYASMAKSDVHDTTGGRIYDYFLDQCRPNEISGTSPMALADIAQTHLPVREIGRNPDLTGRMAILLKKYEDLTTPQSLEQDDHWVVAIGSADYSKSGSVLIYCPYDHIARETKLVETTWRGDFFRDTFSASSSRFGISFDLQAPVEF